MTTKYKNMVLGVYEAIKESYLHDENKPSEAQPTLGSLLNELLARAIGAVVVKQDGTTTMLSLDTPVQDAGDAPTPDAPSEDEPKVE